MFLRTWLQRAARSTMWSVSCLFLLPLLLAASVEFEPVLVADINPNGDASPSYLTPAGDSVYFYAKTGPVKQFFVANDSGATQLTSLPKGVTCISEPDIAPLIAAGSTVFFTVNKENIGFGCQRAEVWRTDGTPEGTRVVWRSGVDSLYADGNGFYALAFDGSGTSSTGVWHSDGTTEGTKLVQEGFSTFTSILTSLGVSDGKLYFLVYLREAEGYELWRADAGGAAKLADLSIRIFEAAAFYQGALYLSDLDGPVWRLPLDSDTPVLWHDDTVFNGYVARMYTIEDRLYMVDVDESIPWEATSTLWRYDGAADKLDKIGDHGSIQALAGMGDSLYFAGAQSVYPIGMSAELMRLPLSSTTPSSVSPEFAPLGGVNISAMVTAGKFVFMIVREPNTIGVSPVDLLQLWATDGTAEGTQRVAILADDGVNAACPCLAAANGTLYFDRDDEDTGVELWKIVPPQEGQSLYLPHLAR